MIIGYARTSTLEQQAGFEAQLRDLNNAGCTKIYQEQTSSRAKRVELENAIEFAREGDVFVVTKLDRLARSMRDLIVIIDQLTKKSVSVKILNLGLDTKTPTGTLILNILGSIAQFEVEMMLERQREGIAKAKSEGKYKGRKSIPEAQQLEIVRMSNEGISKLVIARTVGVGEATVYRVLAAFKKSTSGQV
jgi:DNA invertase Pin-like site-specific DNA recombinase